MSQLIRIITAADPETRNRSIDAFGRSASLDTLLVESAALDQFRRQSDNLYERVRALFFLYSLHRFQLPAKNGLATQGMIPFDGYVHLLNRRFEEAIELFLAVQAAGGPNESISSALAAAYHSLGFPNPSRPGAPQRAFRARQPMDVPHGTSRRPPSARPAGTAPP